MIIRTKKKIYYSSGEALFETCYPNRARKFNIE